ncbi:MAG: hypothetical protein H6618_04450 [Deltaproteobacteria bacterium]|nr:hypothetical protein [Deltaproteobacteria bacterium]
MRLILTHLMIFLYFFHFFSIDAAYTKEKIVPGLSLPGKDDSLMLVRESVNSMSLSGDRLFFVPVQNSLVVERNLVRNASDQNPFEFSKVHELAGLKQGSDWLIQVISDGFLLLNSRTLEMHYYSSDFILVSRRTLWYDKIRPPADMRGEAPESEVQSFRKRFVRGFNQLKRGSRFSGISPVPLAWESAESGQLYFLLTRIPEFPITLLKCQKEDPAQCFVYRGCFVSGFSAVSENLSGIVANASERELLVGLSDKNGLAKLKYNSCYHIVYDSMMRLPERIRDISDIDIDRQNHLFISTRRKDDYFNASLFRWSSDQWKSLLSKEKK